MHFFPPSSQLKHIARKNVEFKTSKIIRISKILKYRLRLHGQFLGRDTTQFLSTFAHCVPIYCFFVVKCKDIKIRKPTENDLSCFHRKRQAYRAAFVS